MTWIGSVPFPAVRPATVEPDAPVLPGPPAPPDPAAFGSAVRDAFDASAQALTAAEAAESAFVHGRGSLQAMEIERAQADVMLGVETAAISRGSQALTSLLNMQV